MWGHGGGPAEGGAPTASAVELDAAKQPCPGHTGVMPPRALKRKLGRVTGRRPQRPAQSPTLVHS